MTERAAVEELESKVSLEVEGLLLMLMFPVFVGASLVLSFVWDLHLVSFIPMLLWIVGFFAWAARGGVPPRIH